MGHDFMDDVFSGVKRTHGHECQAQLDTKLLTPGVVF